MLRFPAPLYDHATRHSTLIAQVPGLCPIHMVHSPPKNILSSFPLVKRCHKEIYYYECGKDQAGDLHFAYRHLLFQTPSYIDDVEIDRHCNKHHKKDVAGEA
jgi:hypothetical protein